jgi:hypothetical protein
MRFGAWIGVQQDHDTHLIPPKSMVHTDLPFGPFLTVAMIILLHVLQIVA